MSGGQEVVAQEQVKARRHAAMLHARAAKGPRGTALSLEAVKALLQVQPRVERSCRTCQNGKVIEINDKLKAGVPLRRVAKEFNIPEQPLSRHAHLHLMLGIAKPTEHPTLQRLEKLYAHATAELEKAVQGEGNAQDSARAINTAGRVLDLIAKVRGDIAAQMGGGIASQLGVKVDEAKRAVDMKARAEASNEHEIARRARAFLETYNKRWPDRAQRVSIARQRTSSAGMIESTEPAALAAGAEVNSTQGLVPQEDGA